MGLGTPCLSMGLDRLNSFNSPGRQTPAGKAGQRLNAVAGIARIAVAISTRQGSVWRLNVLARKYRKVY
jgi:hypothetical protein